MKEGYRRKKEPVENRELILKIATELAGRTGLEKLTLEAVAKKAGLSKGGLLHHFPSKDALFEGLFMESMSQFAEAIKREIDADGSISPAIAYWRATINDQVSEQQKNSMRVILQAAMSKDYYRQFLSEWYQQNLKQIEPGGDLTRDLMTILIADGLWYSNLFGGIGLSKAQKQSITQHLQKL